jgi:hypothetical protein
VPAAERLPARLSRPAFAILATVCLRHERSRRGPTATARPGPDAMVLHVVKARSHTLGKLNMQSPFSWLCTLGSGTDCVWGILSPGPQRSQLIAARR